MNNIRLEIGYGIFMVCIVKKDRKDGGIWQPSGKLEPAGLSASFDAASLWRQSLRGY